MKIISFVILLITTASTGTLFAQHSSNDYFNMALDDTDQGDSVDALNNFAKAIQVNPKDTDAYFWRARFKLDHNDLKGAILDFDKVLELDSMDIVTAADAFNLRDACKFYMENYQSAIRDYTKSIELEDSNPAPYTWRGLSKIKSGDKKGGCADLQKAADMYFPHAVTCLKEYCK